MKYKGGWNMEIWLSTSNRMVTYHLKNLFLGVRKLAQMYHF